MHIERSVVLLSLLFGVGLCGVVALTPPNDPATFFAGVAVLFTGVLVGTVVILIANARRFAHSTPGHGRGL